MVLIRIMRFTLRILIFLILSVCFSCEEQGLFVKCPDCETIEPNNTDLEIKVDIGYRGAATLINVYEGNLEDSILYRSYFTSGPVTTISASINKKYSVTATYYIPDNYYITVDSATPRVKYSKDQCDEPCYFVYDRVLDLRLKYN